VPLHGLTPQEIGVCAGQAPLVHVTAGIAVALPADPLHDGAAPHVTVPFGTGAWQTPVRHVSSVHTSPSLPHPGALPVVPSVTLVFTQPEAGLQESVVHGFESLQLMVVPWHTPDARHLSALVQKLPSLQALPVKTCAAQPVGSLQTPE
jgi:hypothetical protein